MWEAEVGCKRWSMALLRPAKGSVSELLWCCASGQHFVDGELRECCFQVESRHRFLVWLIRTASNLMDHYST